ncbi:MAG: GH32 C-terminal domain-containing protein [Gemmataceae bacterium]
MSEFLGKEATIQIVDRRKGGWGHINVDHIIQGDRPRSSQEVTRQIRIDKRYLHLPVTTGAPKRRMSFVVDGQVVRDFEIEYAITRPQFHVFADVSAFKGKTLTVKTRLPKGGLDAITASDALPEADTLYREKDRPQFHFTSRRGWLNDPNGLVYHDGVWHLFYQHNPYGWAWGNMHWGHATSRDLVHWREGPIALYPPKWGDWAFSGSAVVDSGNTSGWGTADKPPLVAAFTSTGRGECIVSSTDGGTTWQEYEGNPVVRHNGRDPRLLWHAASKQWVMAVYDEDGKPPTGSNRDIAFYTSPDLKKWTFQSRIVGYFECPDLFELPIDGDAKDTRWVLYAADGRYQLGRFDGKTFTPEGDKGQVWHGRFYAAQTFSNAPAGRRVQIGWGSGVEFPGMPFNQQMALPVELTLHRDGKTVRMHARPVRELETLRTNVKRWKDVTVRPAENPLGAVSGELFELVAEIDPGKAATVGFRLGDVPLTWHADRGRLECGGVSAPLPLEKGRLRLHVFVDRGSIEVFGNGGRVALSVPSRAGDRPRPVTAFATGADATIVGLEMHRLRSIWTK